MENKCKGAEKMDKAEGFPPYPSQAGPLPLKGKAFM